MTDALQRLQNWYLGRCNGDWEHSYGVSIDTLDNPGWQIRIDLLETGLDGRTFGPVETRRTEDDWVVARFEEERLCAYRGPVNVNEALGVFLDWAARSR